MNTTTHNEIRQNFIQCDELPMLSGKAPGGEHTGLNMILVGDQEVGKTTLWLNFSSGFQGTGPLEHEQTPGGEIKTFYYAVRPNPDRRAPPPKSDFISLNVWDTAGQEKFHCLTLNYLRQGRIILLVYDVTKPQSFHNAMHHWLEEMNKVTHYMDVFWIANKCDLIPPQELPSLLATHLELITIKCSSYVNESFASPQLFAFSARDGIRFGGCSDFLRQLRALLDDFGQTNDMTRRRIDVTTPTYSNRTMSVGGNSGCEC